MLDNRKEIGVERLIERKSKLLSQIEAFRNQVAGLDIAINMLSDQSFGDDESIGGIGIEEASPSTRHIGVTDALVSLLREVGAAGLNARVAAEIASERGLAVKRQSASSLLSRLKKDGTVVYEDGRYKLREFRRRAVSSEAVGEMEAA